MEHIESSPYKPLYHSWTYDAQSYYRFRHFNNSKSLHALPEMWIRKARINTLHRDVAGAYTDILTKPKGFTTTSLSLVHALVSCLFEGKKKKQGYPFIKQTVMIRMTSFSPLTSYYEKS